MGDGGKTDGRGLERGCDFAIEANSIKFVILTKVTMKSGINCEYSTKRNDS